jgi:hypothetical protein
LYAGTLSRAHRDQESCDAFWLMKHTRGVNINSRTYQRLKEEWIENLRKRQTGKKMNMTPEGIESHRRSIAEARKHNRVLTEGHTEETRAKISASNKEWRKQNMLTLSEEHKRNIGLSRSVEVMIDGVIYSGYRTAARELNMKYPTLRQRVKSPKFPNWREV